MTRHSAGTSRTIVAYISSLSVSPPIFSLNIHHTRTISTGPPDFYRRPAVSQATAWRRCAVVAGREMEKGRKKEGRGELAYLHLTLVQGACLDHPLQKSQCTASIHTPFPNGSLITVLLGRALALRIPPLLFKAFSPCPSRP